MARITAEKPRVLVKVFRSFGFREDRQRGSHLLLTKPGVARPLVIPIHDKLVGVDLIFSNLRTAGITREQYLEALSRL